jgi:glutaminase
MDRIESALLRVEQACSHLKAEGTVASYIAPLALVPRNFGIALATGDGCFEAGARDKFSIQSVSKILALAFALRNIGDDIWQSVGVNPTGRRFNDVDLLRTESTPRNPCVNAGAIAVSALLAQRFEVESLLDFCSLLCGEEIGYDPKMAEAEFGDCANNRQIVEQLRINGVLPQDHDADKAMQFYCKQCSIVMTCAQVARAFAFLANAGCLPGCGTRVIEVSDVGKVLSAMISSGTYDNSGLVLSRIQAPAKSGVSGPIVAVYKGHGAACAWSPGLDQFGNSVAAEAALELLTSELGWSILISADKIRSERPDRRCLQGTRCSMRLVSWLGSIRQLGRGRSCS